MQFYKFEGIITNPDWTEENDKRHILRERARKICLKTTSFNQTLKEAVLLQCNRSHPTIFFMPDHHQESSGLPEQIQAYLKALNLSVKDLHMEEITFITLPIPCSRQPAAMIISTDDDEILERFNLNKLCRPVRKIF